MKHWLLLLAVIYVFAYGDLHASPPRKHLISLQIISYNDTFTLGQPMVFVARITNISKRDILIPDTFALTSNLYPNGADGDMLKTGFYFEIQRVDPFSSISVENDILLWPKKFIQLQPGDSKDFMVDISRHILTYNNFVNQDGTNNDGRLINAKKIYQIKIKYDNIWLPGGKRLKVPLEAESQQITFFLS